MHSVDLQWSSGKSLDVCKYKFKVRITPPQIMVPYRGILMIAPEIHGGYILSYFINKEKTESYEDILLSS